MNSLLLNLHVCLMSRKDEDGQSTSEHALLLLMVAFGCIAGFESVASAVAGSLSDIFSFLRLNPKAIS
jgi:Flp pilus assembly pilin Flp